MKEGKLHCLFSYDCNSFSERKIRLLMDCYHKVFKQILNDKDADITVKNIQCPDVTSFLSVEKGELEELKRLQTFLRDMPLFEWIDDSGILSISKEIEIRNYVDNDEVLRENSVSKGLQIIMNDYCESFRTSKSGWTGTLLLLHSGDIISASGVLKDVQSYIGAEASSDEVRIAYIPKNVIVKFLEKYPRAALNLIRYEEEIARRLSFFWINLE